MYHVLECMTCEWRFSLFSVNHSQHSIYCGRPGGPGENCVATCACLLVGSEKEDCKRYIILTGDFFKLLTTLNGRELIKNVCELMINLTSLVVGMCKQTSDGLDF